MDQKTYSTHHTLIMKKEPKQDENSKLLVNVLTFIKSLY